MPGNPGQDLNWLVTNFVQRVPHVAQAIVVSADGIPLGVSAGFPPDRAERLATVACGLSSLVQGASRAFEGGPVSQTVVEMDYGVMIVMAISDGASLAVLAGPDARLGIVAYEMTRLVERAGQMITPALRGAGVAGGGR